MRGEDFICSSWRECKGSVRKGSAFTKGQLSHVGQHFDLFRDEREFRVVMVGQEVGGRGNARITMAERSKSVHQRSGLIQRFDSEPGRTRRNPHMLGTTLALGEIFGLPPTGDHDDEFLNIGGHRVHMFDCFALVNRLLCAAHELSLKTGKQPRLATPPKRCSATMSATFAPPSRSSNRPSSSSKGSRSGAGVRTSLFR